MRAGAIRPIDSGPSRNMLARLVARLPERLRGWWLVIGCLLAALLFRLVIAESFVIPSASMQPGLEPGDRVFVTKLRSSPPQRGDVVVFDGAATFGPLPRPEGVPGLVARLADLLAGRPNSSDYVKRVIGVGGDRVTCCTGTGQLSINGQPLAEPYLFPGDQPSELRFDIIVPPGRLWLMGDHRSDSADSRSHLGGPGGGTVAVGDVVGPVSFRFWPVDRLGSVAGGDASLAAQPGRRG